MTWGLRAVSGELDSWRQLAQAIPDRTLRSDALHALERKRTNIDGAALFCTIPAARSPALLRLLVAFEILADYLDCVSERAAHEGIRNGLQLHRALQEALDPTLPLSDYYRYQPASRDGGYARALVECCRSHVMLLPSYESVRSLAIRAARLAQVLAVNHEPDAELRDAVLAAWARARFPDVELAWFERAGAASAWLTILALLAFAADPGRSPSAAEAVYRAYLPWVSLAGTMLDSYGDLVEDRSAGAHSYIAHYPNDEFALGRVGEIIRRAIVATTTLPDGPRHTVLASSMVAMYLSKDSVRSREQRAATQALARSAGPLAQALVPVVRCWRIAYGHQSDGAELPAAASNARLPPSAPLPPALQTFAFWRDPHAYLAWCRRRYGRTFTIRASGMAPLVFFCRPQEIKSIVRAPADVLHPGKGAAVLAPLVGEGSFMLADEDSHLAGRKAILPAFHRGRVHDHAAMIAETTREEIVRWPRDRAFAVHPYLRTLSLRIILQTVFGPGHPKLRQLHTRLLAMLSVTGTLALQEPQVRSLPPWRGIWRSFLVERDVVHSLLDELIAEEAHAPAHDAGLLAMLVAAETSPRANPLHVREGLMSVILAGHETTASSLAWAFQLLAHNPTVATRLQESLDSGERRYLAATVYEVLRHRPVFMFTIPRVVNKPFELAGRRYQPPEQLVGCIHLMHNDPELFDEPNRFWPERFLADDPPAEIWMPWGGGRKRCPGRHLATLEMQTVLATVLADLQVLPAARRVEKARWRSVIVTPGQGSRIVLRSRIGASGTLRSSEPRIFLPGEG